MEHSEGAGRVQMRLYIFEAVLCMDVCSEDLMDGI
jgi:hypothetical protein